MKKISKLILLINLSLYISIFSNISRAQENSSTTEEKSIPPVEAKDDKNVEDKNIKLEQSINKANDNYLNWLANRHTEKIDKDIKNSTDNKKSKSTNIKETKEIKESDENKQKSSIKTLVTSSISSNNQTQNIVKDNPISNSYEDKNNTDNNIISKYGKIITQKKIASDLIAWVIEKNSKRIVMFTNNNQSIIIAGVAWDTATNLNLNMQFSSYLGNNHSTQNKNFLLNLEQGKKLNNKKFDIPASIETLDKLSGVKEGNASLLDTIYIIFDPRCPYCRQAYYKSRPYIKQGKSIKWIPALVLGDSEEAQKQAAALLQANYLEQPKILQKILGEKENASNLTIKDSTKQALNTNKQYLFTAAKNSNIVQIGVPMAFFFDKRTGKARMLAGVSENEVLEEIFKGI